jgi:hypothetical protein
MSLEAYFGQRVPEAWNARYDEQVSRADEGAELLEKMNASNFTLEVRVSDRPDVSFNLRIEKGRMSVSDTADPEPLLILVMSAENARHIEREVGPSPMQLLGGVGGHADFVITPNRAEHIRELEGTVGISVTGDPSWQVVMHFGPEPIPDPAPTRITLGGAEYAMLRSGELDLQGAFMTQKLALDGEVEFAMKMALALMAEE